MIVFRANLNSPKSNEPAAYLGLRMCKTRFWVSSKESAIRVKTEAARLFIAVLALILVGMLSGSLGNFNDEPVQAAKLHNPQKVSNPKAKKVAQKNLTKKSSRLTDF
jgi:hypothetical protein